MYKPILCVLELTNRCNLRCPHCASDSGKSRCYEMSRNELHTIGIRSNGDVLGCLSLGDDFIEANLLETPLSEIWNSGKYFQRFRKKEESLCGTCGKCTFGKKCKAGCTAMAISSTNTIGDNTYCVRRLEEKRLLQELFD